MMKLAAVADIHAPLYLDLFKRSLDSFVKTNDSITCFLLCGDIVERGRFEHLDEISQNLDKIHFPIYGCFGNNEYRDYEAVIREKLPSVNFLNDSFVTFESNNLTFAIVGSRGVLDEPTFWQKKNWPDIENVYDERTRSLTDLANRCRADFRILLIHYPPTLKILEGENNKFLRQMGSSRLESLIRRFDLVVTAHSHRGKKMVEVDGVQVVNVSLPLNNQITVLDLTKRKGLDSFF